MSVREDFKVVGTRPIRPDGIEKVTGRARFGADLVLPNMLYGKVLRSEYAHARIKSIDTSEAEKVVGVKAIVTGADFPTLQKGMVEAGEAPADQWDLARNVIARDKALYHGHAIAAIAATSIAAAEEALTKIKVDYEPLTPVLDLETAMAENAPLLHDDLYTQGLPEKVTKPSNIATFMELKRGDVDVGFNEADVVVERTFTTSTVHQGYIEPHAVTAQTTEDGKCEIWCCTQGPFEVRSMTAEVTGLDPSQVKVTPSEIGGGFGGKTTVYLEPLAAMLSRKARRPVRLVMTREEVLRATGPTSASRIKIKIGAKNDGTITAAQALLDYEAGAFKGSPMGPGAMCVFASYKLENFLIQGNDVVVNKPKVAAYRAPGAPMAAYAAESVLDEIARTLKIDPIDFRLQNAVHEGIQATYGPKFQPVGLIECLEAARNHPHYKAPLGPNQGRGIAVGFWFNAGMQSSAAVHLDESGNAIVVTGNPDIGGSRASMALMAAEELGLPIEKVRPIVTDTDNAGVTNVTGGSRVTFATGMAVIQAARDIVKQLKARAAATWGLDTDDLDFQDGKVIPPPGAGDDVKPLAVSDIAKNAARTGGPISGRASLNARGAGPGFGVHLCDLEVDRDTGKIDIVRYTAIQDAGKAIHPSYVEGQYQGGVAQGVGWALNEEYIYDENGKMENPGFLDYRVPVASDLPKIETVIVEVPNPNHPHGVRGVGETPIVPPLATVANAFTDATGIRMTHLPMSPPRVLEALEAAGTDIPLAAG